MSPIPPRARAMLRQASQTAAANKRTAAEQLYRQIIDEFPELPDGWVGLADVLNDPDAQRAAYEHALALDSSHTEAINGLKKLNNEYVPDEPLLAPEPTPLVVSEPIKPVVSPAPPAPQPFNTPSYAPQRPTDDEALVLYCSTHPDVRTNLRCYSCGKLICSRCARHTPVGWRCNTCIYEAQEVFFNAEAVHYIVAFIVSGILGAIGGIIVPLIGWLTLFLAAGVGSLIGRIAFRLTGRRRGRYLPHIVAAAVVIGGLMPALLSVLVTFAAVSITGEVGFWGSFDIIWRLIYVGLAAVSAFYQVR